MALLFSFLVSFVGQAAVYFGLVGLVYLGVWRWGAKAFQARRIRISRSRQPESRLMWESLHSLVTLAAGTGQGLAVYALYREGWTQLTPDLTGWSAVGTVGIFLCLLVLNDAWFYAFHRLLHRPWWFRRIHAVHHQSIDVNPFSSYSFHVVEGLLLTGWVIPAALVLPMPLPVLMVLQGIGTANNLMAHLGYELLPSWWVRVPLLRWTNTATFHSLHHTRFKGNYGLFFRLWDRLLGTELSGYEDAFAAAHDAASEASSPRRA